MTRAFFVGIALSLAATSWAQSNAQNAITSSGSADIEFILKAAEGGLAEVELGKIAAQQATNDDVKKFGQKMVDEHGKGADELKALAQRRGIKLPEELPAKDRSLKDRLSKLKGSQFDRTYMRNMVTDHRLDLAEFKREANSGRDPEVKAWAAQKVPMLEEHLKEAQAANKTKTGAAN